MLTYKIRCHHDLRGIRTFVALLISFVPLGSPVFAQEKAASPAGPSAREKSQDTLGFLTQKTWMQMRRAPTAFKDLEKALSLEDCLRIARENSGRLIIANDRLKAAKMAYLDKKRDLLPPLSFKLNVKEGYLNTGNGQTFRAMGGHVVSDFPIYDAEAKFKVLEQAKNAYLQARLARRQTENALGFVVRQTYYQLAQVTMLRKMQKTLQTKAQEIAARAEEMAKKNLLKPVELTEIRLRRKEIQDQTVSLDNQYLLLQLAMKQVLNVYPDYSLKIRTDLGYAEPPLNLDQCLRLAYQNRPELVRAYMTSQAAKVARDLRYATNAMNVSINTQIGLRAEDFNGAVEGMQTRIDGRMGIKVSIPLGPNTLKYEPLFVKEVKEVGQTTPTDYNEHYGILEFYNNTSDRTNLEANIGYEDSLDDEESLRKTTASDVGNLILLIEQARNNVGRAQFDFTLAQQRLKVLLGEVQTGTGVSMNDEMMGYTGVSDATKRLVSTRYEFFDRFNRLNQALGIDGYWDPHAGTFKEPLTPVKPSPENLRKWYEFSRDPLLEEDADILKTPPYEDYLQPAGTQLTWDKFINSKQTYPLLHYVPEYPKVSVHGELRTRLHVCRETMDLGANIQPILRNGVVQDPELSAAPAQDLEKQYLQINDNFVDFLQRLLGSLEMDFTRYIKATFTVRVDNAYFGGYKAPRESTFMPIGLQETDYFTRIYEAYLKVLDFLSLDGLTLKAGRIIDDLDLGFVLNNKDKEDNGDEVQLIYFSNPWQFQVEYVHPVFDKLKNHFGLGDATDGTIAFVRYKADTWRYTLASLVPLEDDKILAPINIVNQLLWDPIPPLETEVAVIYQLGKLPDVEDQHKSSLGMNLRAKYKFDLPLYPQLGCNFLLTQGSKENQQKKDFTGSGNTLPWGSIVQLQPINVYMIESSASFQVAKNSNLTFKHYYFSQYRSRRQTVSDPRFDIGGIFIPANGHNKDIGHEFDAIHEVGLLDNLKSEMSVGWFLPGHAYGQNPDSPNPGAGWQKIPFKFRWQMTFNF